MQSTTPFITIGSKGTSRPVDLRNLTPPLKLGMNNLRWDRRTGDPAANEAHGWVSNNGEPFELLRLEDAIRRGKVRPIKNVSWVQAGQLHHGTAYVPADWNPADGQLSYIAVDSATWPHGRIEAKRINDGRNVKFVATLDLHSVRASPDGHSQTQERALPLGEFYEEGKARIVIGNRYERSSAARSACIKHHGFSCVACGFDFEDFYGEIGRGFIHAHHELPISKGQRSTSVEKDLVPICPNCHAMIHRNRQALTIAELKARIQNRKSR